MSELLTADEFLAPTRVKTDEIELPSGGKVRVRALDVGTRDAFLELGAAEGSDRRYLSRLLVAKCCVNKAGERIFGDDAMEKLVTAPAEDVELIAQTAMRLSGIKTKAEAEQDGPND